MKTCRTCTKGLLEKRKNEIFVERIIENRPYWQPLRPHSIHTSFQDMIQNGPPNIEGIVKGREHKFAEYNNLQKRSKRMISDDSERNQFAWGRQPINVPDEEV